MKLSLYALLIFTLQTVVGQADQERVSIFLNTFSAKHNVPVEGVKKILDQAEFQQSTLDLIQRPAEAMPWYKYQAIFLTEDRIDRGVQFWQEHQTTLTSISDEYDIPPEIILGILGVETYFGERKGNHRVLDALYTLAFGYPRRSKFFQSELENFLLLVEEENIDPLTITGSYAGAIGYCQFMPSSYRAYARSYEKESNRDLVNSPEDAMASIANYLKVHRWKKGEEYILHVRKQKTSKTPEKQSLKPKFTVDHYKNIGFTPLKPIKGDTPVALISLAGENGPEYWFGMHNFYVITRYNHSALYAMAVIQLSNAIKEKSSNVE